MQNIYIYKHIFHMDLLEGLTEKNIAYQAVNLDAFHDL